MTANILGWNWLQPLKVLYGLLIDLISCSVFCVLVQWPMNIIGDRFDSEYSWLELAPTAEWWGGGGGGYASLKGLPPIAISPFYKR